MASRREYLAAVGGLGAVGIAGCSSLPVGGSGGGSWSERYGEAGKRTFLWNTLPLEDGYLLTGSQSTDERSQDALVIKLDGDHEVEWQEPFGGDGWDWLQSTVSTEDGFVAFGSKGGSAWLVGLDEDGNLEWESTYGAENTRTWGWRMTAADEGFILVGQDQPESGPRQGWVRKTDAEGETAWKTEYGAEDDSQTRLSGVVRDGNGYLAAGQKRVADSRVGVVVRVTDDGDIDWEERYEEGGLGTIVADGDGYIAAGRSADDEAQLVAITADGDERWEETYDKEDRANFGDVVPVSGGLFGDDGYIAVGTARITVSEPRRGLAWVVGLDASGEVQTEHVADDDLDSMVFAVSETDGGYVVTGSVTEDPDSEENARDGWVFQTSGADAVGDLDTDVF